MRSHGPLGVITGAGSLTARSLLDLALFEDLDDALVIVVGAELVLEGLLGCTVERALCAVPVMDSVSCCMGLRDCSWPGLLVGDHDLEAADYLSLLLS